MQATSLRDEDVQCLCLIPKSPLDGSGCGAGEVSEIGRPDTSAASWMLTPLLTSCPNTRPFAAMSAAPISVEVEGQIIGHPMRHRRSDRR